MERNSTVQNTRNTRTTAIIIAGFAIAIIGRLLDWSLVTIFALLAALVVSSWLVTYWQTWRSLAWFRRYNRYSARVREGEANAVIAELSVQRESGDHAPETALILAAAYNYQGRGQAAEALAHEAFDAITVGGGGDTAALSRRARRDLAYLTRFDALLAQGRFTEAASGLRERIKHAIQPNFLSALTAWAYYLGGDHAQVRDLLATIQEPGTRFDNRRLLSPRFEFTVAFLRHTLDGADTLALMDQHRAIIDEWEATAVRNANNPYGARLSAVIAEMRAALGDARGHEQPDGRASAAGG